MRRIKFHILLIFSGFFLPSARGQFSDNAVVPNMVTAAHTVMPHGGGANLPKDSVHTTTVLSGSYTYEDSVQMGEIAVKKMDKNAIKSFFSFLKKDREEGKRKILSSKAYYNMAVLMARFKNYPLALKYFSLANVFENAGVADNKYKLNFDSSLLDFPMPLFDQDSVQEHPEKYVVGTDTLLVSNRDRNIDSKPVSYKKLIAPFKDEEEGLAYGIILHLKQPEFGKRKQFALFNNVGHMFISLIKYEADGKSVSRTFGFYPKKDNPLSATPLIPGTSSTFKNDSLHLWDEAVGKFINYKQFKLILHLVKQYSRKRYHLNKNNCTDFGLCIAGVAGIEIQDTQGSWPLGRGNDPGDTGQSILEGKVLNADKNAPSKLFICTSN